MERKTSKPRSPVAPTITREEQSLSRATVILLRTLVEGKGLSSTLFDAKQELVQALTIAWEFPLAFVFLPLAPANDALVLEWVGC